MCEKAVKVQELWEPHWGDFIADKGDYSQATVVISHRKNPFSTKPELNKDELTWLPRQDDLQRMAQEHYGGNFLEENNLDCQYDLLESFYLFVGGLTTEGGTFEQLWLMFVMKEKFNKTWNNIKEDWFER